MGEMSREENRIHTARMLLGDIGEDPTREGLAETPKRMARAWEEMFSGYGPMPNLKLFSNLEEDLTVVYDEIILLKDIEFYSTCEHHFLPFFGKVHVGYIPGNSVIGISKLARIVDHFSHRLQIQERLTSQIAEVMVEDGGAQGAAVMVEAQHLCMVMRGVKKQNSVMVTSAVRGKFLEDAKARAEFFSLIRK